MENNYCVGFLNFILIIKIIPCKRKEEKNKRSSNIDTRLRYFCLTSSFLHIYMQANNCIKKIFKRKEF